MAIELPPKRKEILRFLAHWRSRGEVPPSVREVGEAVALKSSQTVYHHLGRLEQAGYIERASDRHRTPRLTDRGWEAAGEMPFMGRIAAGRGLEAVVAGDEAYSLASEFISSRNGRQRYLLRVVGQSMTGARIEDGDLLVVEENEDPPNGAIVVALLDGGEEVTVKRLYREGGNVRLKPDNGDHEDIILPGERVRIQGVVLYVTHPPAV